MNHNFKNIVRVISHKNSLFSFVYQTFNKINIFINKRLDDETFAQKKYYENTGNKLDLKNPQTFDEKLWWLKIHLHNPLMTICSDKFLVREYVKECGLEYILNDLYGIYEKADDIDYELLPKEFFLKCNNASGYNFLCSDKATFQKKRVARKLNKGLKQNFYYHSREWNYKDIVPKIICERVLRSKNLEPLIDYRFLCFNGKVKYIFVDIDTCAEDGSHRQDAKRNVYDENMNLLDVRVTREHFPPELVPKPGNFDEMKTIAEKLSRPFIHCRVDLYNIDGIIYFGEITFYHASACNKIEPKEWAYKLGECIDLSHVEL